MILRRVNEYLYIGPRADGVATITSEALQATTERHQLKLAVSDMSGDRDLCDRG
jgi:hypothetical protein